jgi:two-component system nitrogen regulation sensor histidine kinase NtrY
VARFTVAWKSMAFSPDKPGHGMPVGPLPTQRIALGRTRRRIHYEHRIRLWLAAFVLPFVVCVTVLVYHETLSRLLAIAAGFMAALVSAVAGMYFFEQLVRPLQTLANVVAALREDDFSFRARGARRGDSLGDLAMEINALAGTLQRQRSSARDALTLVERVMTSMQSPVLAFDETSHLRLLNPAAESVFGLPRRSSLGQTAQPLHIDGLLVTADEGLYSSKRPTVEAGSGDTRWSVRRTTFRLQGVPHSLFVLSDVAAVLREEERLAWQRLIRVLSHEINNSLTPIKSIAGSLRTRLPRMVDSNRDSSLDIMPDMHRGLAVIEERAASLNRFLQAYQQLMRLPDPRLQTVSLGALLEQVVLLETRLRVVLQAGPTVFLHADPDQLQQMLINLIRNAADAALEPKTSGEADVCVRWRLTAGFATIQIVDNGLGLMNPENVFVPFYTTKPEGSGIGLVLAQQIAIAHKGSISLHNNPDAGGCIAEVRLPLAAFAKSD